MVTSDDFAPSLYHRQHRVPELDDVAHAGASLVQLLKVLEHFDSNPTETGE
jgi:hypothetical protein